MLTGNSFYKAMERSMNNNRKLFDAFEKCANYSVLTALVVNTVKSMARFKRVPEDVIIPDVYNKLKERAAKA